MSGSSSEIREELSEMNDLFNDVDLNQMERIRNEFSIDESEDEEQMIAYQANNSDQLMRQQRKRHQAKRLILKYTNCIYTYEQVHGKIKQRLKQLKACAIFRVQINNTQFEYKAYVELSSKCNITNTQLFSIGNCGCFIEIPTKTRREIIQEFIQYDKTPLTENLDLQQVLNYQRQVAARNNQGDIQQKQIRIKKICLQYQQIQHTKEELLLALQNLMHGSVEKYVIGFEKLQNHEGNKAHCYLELDQKIGITNKEFFNIFGQQGYFWELKGQVKTYICRIQEIDNSPLCSIDLQTELSQRYIRRNAQLESLEVNGIKKSLQNYTISLNQIQQSLIYIKICKQEKEMLARQLKEDRPQVVKMQLRNRALEFVLEWAEKKRHFYLYSKQSNYGKSTFLRMLEQNFRSSAYSQKEIFQDSILPDSQILIFDEFSYIPFVDLSKMADGDYSYPQKHTNPIKLNKPILFLASNQHPNNIYCEKVIGGQLMEDRVSQFYNRFYVIELESYDVPFEPRSKLVNNVRVIENEIDQSEGIRNIEAFNQLRNEGQNELPEFDLIQSMSGMSIESHISQRRSQEDYWPRQNAPQENNDQQ